MVDSEAVVLCNKSFDGNQTIRWFLDTWSAERNHAVITVTANGLWLHKGLHEVPDAWLSDAKAAHELLKSSADADVSQYVTHVNSIVPNGPLVPISKGATHG